MDPTDCQGDIEISCGHKKCQLCIHPQACTVVIENRYVTHRAVLHTWDGVFGLAADSDGGASAFRPNPFAAAPLRPKIAFIPVTL